MPTPPADWRAGSRRRPISLAPSASSTSCWRPSPLAETMAAAGAMYLPDRLHAVRIAVKKLRYAFEVSAEITGRHAPLDLDHLRRTQALLGRLHDLQVLIDRVRQMQASATPT